MYKSQKETVNKRAITRFSVAHIPVGYSYARRPKNSVVVGPLWSTDANSTRASQRHSQKSASAHPFRSEARRTLGLVDL